MSEWKIVKLGEVISIKGGFSYKGDHIGKGSTLLLGMGCVSFNHTFLNTGARFYSGDTPDTFLVESGDIVIATRQQSDNLPILGAPAIIPNALKDKRVIVGTNLYKLINESDIKNDYLFWLLRSPDYRNHIDSCSKGSTVKMITKDAVESFEFHCPDKVEREIISGFLWSIEKKIDLLHRQNKTLEAMAETLFRQWFVEEAQEDWKEKTLKEVCVINNGYAFQSPTYTESGQKILRTLNFSNHWIDLKGFVYISDDLAKSFEKYYLKRNDFLLVMVGASLGNFAIVTKDVLPLLQNQNMWCFRALESVPQHFLNFVLRKLIAETLHGASGSAREFFQKGVFYDLNITVPPLDLMKKFEVTAEAFFSKIELNRYQIHTLETLRDTLLPKLMSGEVRVDYP